MHSVNFDSIRQELLRCNHVGYSLTCLLIEGILHEFLLQPEVLELLLLLSFTLQILDGVLQA